MLATTWCLSRKAVASDLDKVCFSYDALIVAEIKVASGAEERTAREEAEGQVQDISRRLVVAQEQVAEFAQHRETEAETLLQQVESALSSLPSAVDPAIAAVLQVTIMSQCGLDYSLQCNVHQRCICNCISCLQGLQQKLAESVDEAAAFSAQQKADAERTKRTYSQVGASNQP